MSRPADLDLLLLGKTGNGKSATGNSILGREAFISEPSPTSVTKNVTSEVSEYKGRIIKVVDGPGVSDTEENDLEAVKLVVNATARAIALNPLGYHAFLLLVKYGDRFTKEEREAVALLKTIFSPSIIRDYCILTFTRGDDFERDSRKTGQTFEQWCRNLQGGLRDIYHECGCRVVLFDNVTEDVNKKNVQRENLIRLVESLQTQGRRYNDKHFSKASEAREKFMIQAKEPLIRDEVQREYSLILQKLEQIDQIANLKDKLPALEALRKRADTLLKSIKAQDKGTGALHKLVETVESIVNSIQRDVQVCQKMIADAEKWRNQEKKSKEERENFERLMKEQQEQFRHRASENTRKFKHQYRKTKEEGDGITGAVITAIATGILTLVFAVVTRCSVM